MSPFQRVMKLAMGENAPELNELNAQESLPQTKETEDKSESQEYPAEKAA